jgi:hypothetical protein
MERRWPKISIVTVSHGHDALTDRTIRERVAAETKRRPGPGP